MPILVKYNNVAVVDKATETTPSSTDVQDWAKIDETKNDDEYLGIFTAEYKGSSVNKPRFFIDSGWKIGYFSQSRSDTDGVFTTPPVVNISIDKPATSSGITLYFSDDEQDYPAEIVLTWNDTDSRTFYPNSNIYFCLHNAQNYSKLSIEFRRWNKPYHMAKMYAYELGEKMEFTAKNLLSCVLKENANIVCDEVVQNTFDFSVYTDGERSFQNKQTLQIYQTIPDEPQPYYMGDYKISEVKSVRKINPQSKHVYTFRAYTVLKDLESRMITAENANLYKWASFDWWLRQFVFSDTDIPFEVEDSLKPIAVYGKFTNQISRKNALQQICFVAGAWIDCSRSDRIHIRPCADYINNSTPILSTPEREIFAGDTLEEKSIYKYLVYNISGLRTWQSGVNYEASEASEPVFVDEVLYEAIKDHTSSEENKPPNATYWRVKQSRWSFSNPAVNDSNNSKDFALSLWSANMDSVLANYAKHYFNNLWYSAKSVYNGHLPGYPIDLDGFVGTAISQSIDFSVQKDFVTGSYKGVL